MKNFIFCAVIIFSKFTKPVLRAHNQQLMMDMMNTKYYLTKCTVKISAQLCKFVTISGAKFYGNGSYEL